MTVYVIGLDIGGANIKAADGESRSQSVPFAVWKSPDQLSDVLVQILNSFPTADAIAVTMTAELADCFQTKAEGVESVLRSVEAAAPSMPLFVWQTGAEFVSADTAREIPLLVAAANWHALATWVGRMVPQSGAILIDIGSTTTDIIPLLRGVPVPNGLTDRERLQSGELVYTGVRRTPVAALAQSLPFRGEICPMAAELFATTLDVYLTLGDIADDSVDRDTANGRPATADAAHDRLARMLCADRQEFSAADALAAAQYLADVQCRRVQAAINGVLDGLAAPCENVLTSGSGEFLARRIIEDNPRLRKATLTSLNDVFGAGIGESACAYAVARLARERVSQSESSF